MMFFGIAIFTFCLWAVFSKQFCDGLVSKHLLTFSAITAAITILDPKNRDSAIAALVLLIAGLIYWAVRHRALISQRLNEIFH